VAIAFLIEEKLRQKKELGDG